MVIQHDDDKFANHQSANQCLLSMVGARAARWLGDYVGHRYKYRYSDDHDAYNDANKDLTDDFPLIALDPDTTSLNPLIAYLKAAA
jgi:hypothetical protein